MSVVVEPSSEGRLTDSQSLANCPPLFLLNSKGEATRLLKAGGLFLNNTPVKQDRTLTSEDLIKERFFVLRSGKVGHQVVLLDT